MNRRALLLSGVGAAGAVVVGWALLPPRERLGGVDALPVAAGEVALNGWIKIAADGAVMLAMHRSEMGQGPHTALAMLVAEELDVALASVRLFDAPADRLYGNVATMVASVPYFHPRETEPGNETAPARAGQWVVAKTKWRGEVAVAANELVTSRGVARDGLALEERHHHVEALFHHPALLVRVDAEHPRVGGELTGPDAEHHPAPGEVVEHHDPVGQDQRVVIGQRVDPGAEPDVAGPLSGRGDEDLG